MSANLGELAFSCVGGNGGVESLTAHQNFLKIPTPPFLSSIYLWLCWVFVATCRFSLVVASRGYSLVAVRGLLTAVASLVAEHGFLGE